MNDYDRTSALTSFELSTNRAQIFLRAQLAHRVGAAAPTVNLCTDCGPAGGSEYIVRLFGEELTPDPQVCDVFRPPERSGSEEQSKPFKMRSICLLKGRQV